MAAKHVSADDLSALHHYCSQNTKAIGGLHLHGATLPSDLDAIAERSAKIAELAAELSAKEATAQAEAKKQRAS